MRWFYVSLLGAFLSIDATILNDVHARPVSYPGGWTGMLMNDGDKNSIRIHYSPTSKLSVGYRLEYWRNTEIIFNGVQMNNLLQRWNNPDSQANLYLKSGIGVAYSDEGYFDGKTSPAGFTGIATDWEDRRFFVSYENRYTAVEEIDNFYQQYIRIGVAPYIGDYGDLHTWFLLQVEQMIIDDEDTLTITPIVAFLKNVHLIEIGVSNHEEVLLNYIFRY